MQSDLVTASIEKHNEKVDEESEKPNVESDEKKEAEPAEGEGEDVDEAKMKAGEAEKDTYDEMRKKLESRSRELI